MANYKPLYISGPQTGLVQEREEFLLPPDAFPRLQNAYVFREKIVRKNGCRFIGRLRRAFVDAPFANFFFTAAQTVNVNLFSGFGFSVLTQPNASLVPGTPDKPLIIKIGAPINQTLTDTTGTGVLTISGAGTVIISATINYVSWILTLTSNAAAAASPVTITYAYFPNLPVMGDLTYEQDNENSEVYIFFDTIYAYIFDSGFFREYISGTTWKGTDTDFFWPMNYWRDPNNTKIFWVTNFNKVSGTPPGDPIRFTNGILWNDFAPQINSAGDRLQQCLAMVPFRSRMLVVRTWEGTTLAGSVQYFQRIRWAAIGNPFSDVSTIITAGNESPNAWRDDIRGKGGFLDIPTNQAITAIGFVRDNLVIYCERSTWQLRYTGNSIAPFQIERVNAELGTESPFSAIQFNTSLVGIGDKGIVECDSFKSNTIDIKIPDLVFDIRNVENANRRVYGIRDFENRLAFWTFPLNNGDGSDIYPNQRLVYNYENDSWALFDDSFTCFGNFQTGDELTWEEAEMKWQDADFSWVYQPALFPFIAAGNQQGFVVLIDQLTSNEDTLYVGGFTGRNANSTIVNCPDHNLITGQVVQMHNLIGNWSDIDEGIFSIVVQDANNFELWQYNPINGQFDIPNSHANVTYVGGGTISVRDNFSIVSKKFNNVEMGEAIQLGMMDVLTETTDLGAITCNIYVDYSDQTPVNTYPENVNNTTDSPDLFFNAVIPTTTTGTSTKQWQRFYCPVRGSFITIEYTLNNAQMVGNEQESEVIIHAQILWMRPAGRQLTYGAI